MIALLLAIAAEGPAMRLGSAEADGTAVVLILNHAGAIATRVRCPPSQWIVPADAAAALIGSPGAMASVIAHDGALTSTDQLGPARYACVIAPPATTPR